MTSFHAEVNMGMKEQPLAANVQGSRDELPHAANF